MYKKITIFTTLFMLFAVSLSAQSAEFKAKEKLIKETFKLDSNGNLTYDTVMTFNGVSKQDIFIRCKNYFTYNYVSGEDVLQVDEPEKGVLVGKGLYTNVLNTKIVMSHVNYCYWHVIKFECKDDKVRVTLTFQKVELRGDVTSSHPITNRHVSQLYPFDKPMSAVRKHDMESLIKINERVELMFKGVNKTISSGNTDNETSDF
jgi:hypothetical protein